jgi:hypothetical protein
VPSRRIADLAFTGKLDAADRALRRRGHGLNDPEASWLRAYVAAARGEFAAAERLARSVRSSHGADRAVRARAAITLGSVLRQTNRHADARVVDRTALRSARDAATRAHLLIGLAADAVGLGDLAAVDRAIARIGPRPAGGWRVAVRLRWVRCERELLAGRPIAAARHARSAVRRARSAGAIRHEAKSELFLGAALAGLEPASSARALRRARALASRVGARPVADVADALLGRSPARR